MKNKLHIKINTVPGYPKGSELAIATKDGVPLSRFWRDRIKDSKIDNCLEILKKPASKNSSNRSDSK